MKISAALREWLVDGMRGSSLIDPVPDLAFAYLEGESTSTLVIIGFHERSKLENSGKLDSIVMIDGISFYCRQTDLLDRPSHSIMDIENGKIIFNEIE